jgi:hypothetical protein
MPDVLGWTWDGNDRSLSRWRRVQVAAVAAAAADLLLQAGNFQVAVDTH